MRTRKQDRQYDTSVELYPERFAVLISRNISMSQGCRHLTALGIHDFNRQIEDMIEEEFANCLEVLRQYGVVIETKKYAKDFMRLYDFTDDDFSLDKLIKADYRRRKAAGLVVPMEKNSLKTRLSLPNCPLSSGPMVLANV